jgi:hypothetical protein
MLLWLRLFVVVSDGSMCGGAADGATAQPCLTAPLLEALTVLVTLSTAVTGSLGTLP